MLYADYSQLTQHIKAWGETLGFQQVGIASIDLSLAEQRLHDWLAQQYHGDMDYMQRHGLKRSRPDLLESGTLSVISVRMDYLPDTHERMENLLNMPHLAYISRYALGRDYHKLLRKRLASLAKSIQQAIGEFHYRVFVDSAPVLEKPLAQQAGLGWIGKHTNLLNQQAGSWFFLGEIYTDLPLPPDDAAESHCGRCQACMQICPTQAIVAPYQLDARRCISYLTIELAGAIPESLRPLLGNRIYGCDDCQLICPWNRFAQHTIETDFLPRHGLDTAHLLDLFAWNESEFLARTEGSAIRRIGHERWLRNIAIALGNGIDTPAVRAALQARLKHPSHLVNSHVQWALGQLNNNATN
jgi:epoxyqueuosine reductase